MGAKIICMASAKGGSGKTVLTATFGTFLVGIGKKVLLVDTDAATNGLTLLHTKEVLLQGELALNEKREPRGVYEKVSVDNPPEIVKLKSGVHLIPATYAFKNTESVDAKDYELSLGQIIFILESEYDYIFLDAQAGSDIFAHIAMSRRISHEVVIVSEYDPMSAAGVERLKGFFREDLTYPRTWVLLNKMLPDFVQSFSDFLEVAKYLSPIPWDAEVVKAYARRRLALDMQNGNEYTIAISQTLKGLLGDEISKELAKWVEQSKTGLLQPIVQQYEDAEKELKGIILEKALMEKNSRDNRLSRILLGYLLTGVTSITIGLLTDYTVIGQAISETLIGNSTIARILFAVLVIFGVWLMFYKGLDYFYKSETRASSLEFELSKLERREDILKERLKKLEILREADFDSLIKNAR